MKKKTIYIIIGVILLALLIQYIRFKNALAEVENSVWSEGDATLKVHAWPFSKIVNV